MLCLNNDFLIFAVNVELQARFRGLTVSKDNEQRANQVSVHHSTARYAILFVALEDLTIKIEKFHLLTLV